MRPGDLFQWTGTASLTLEPGDVALVIECGLKESSPVEYVRFMLKGTVWEMTERWFALNTETIDETR